jgi:hypothetical protein
VHASFCALRGMLENVNRRTGVIYVSLRRGGVLVNRLRPRKDSIHGWNDSRAAGKT